MSDNKNIKERLSKDSILVSIQTKEILALDITPMRKFDGKMLKKLVNKFSRLNRTR